MFCHCCRIFGPIGCGEGTATLIRTRRILTQLKHDIVSNIEKISLDLHGNPLTEAMKHEVRERNGMNPLVVLIALLARWCIDESYSLGQRR